MLTYEEYAEIRDSKGLRDSDVARMAEVNPTTFSEWKKGKATPKYEKMTKIERALGVVQLFTEDNYIVVPTDPAPAAVVPVPDKFDQELLDLYHNATDDAKTSVMTLLKASQKKSSASLKEA